MALLKVNNIQLTQFGELRCSAYRDEAVAFADDQIRSFIAGNKFVQFIDYCEEWSRNHGVIPEWKLAYDLVKDHGWTSPDPYCIQEEPQYGRGFPSKYRYLSETETALARRNFMTCPLALQQLDRCSRLNIRIPGFSSLEVYYSKVVDNLKKECIHA